MRLHATHSFLLSILLLAAASPAICQVDTKAGEALAKKGGSGLAACAQCHGANGEGQAPAGFPRLAGQNKIYLEKQLQDFKVKQGRNSPIMQPIAQALSALQMAEVSDYYASLPAEKSGARVDKPSSSRGFELAQHGKWDKGMPACFACHGAKGAGIAPFFPALAGQNAMYISKQLNAWKTGARSNDPQGLMKAVAEKMNAEEIAAVSAYLENMQ